MAAWIETRHTGNRVSEDGNSNRSRWMECQYAHPEHGGGRGEEYAAFLTDHLKPAIDALRPKLAALVA